MADWRGNMRDWFRARLKAALYMFLAVMVLGGGSVWLAYWLQYFSLATARDLTISIVTYCVAISFGGIIDLLLDTTKSGEAKLGCAVVAFVGFAPFLYLISRTMREHGDLNGHFVSGWWVSLCVAPSWIVWWWANGSDARFQATAAEAAAGGNPLQQLKDKQ